MLIEQIHFPLENNSNSTPSLLNIIVVVMLLIGVGAIIYGLMENETLIAPPLKPIPDEKQ
ncbi:MAG: hypothetical protein U0T74_01175 [Chitinophagales bacterium]